MQPDVLCMQETKLGRRGVPGADVRGAGLRDAPTTVRGSGTGWRSCRRSGSTTSTMNFVDGGEPDPDARIISATLRRHPRLQRVRPERPQAEDDRTTSTSCDGSPSCGGTSPRRAHAGPAGDRRRRLQHRPGRHRRLRPGKFVGAHPHQPGGTGAARRTVRVGTGRPVPAAPHATPKLYSWWDYRAGDFHQGRGLRIDLVLGSAPIAERCSGV